MQTEDKVFMIVFSTIIIGLTSVFLYGVYLS